MRTQKRLPDECFCIGKDGTTLENGDRIYNGQFFKAVFDGATPKGDKLWNGKPGDVYVSELLAKAMDHIDPMSDAETVTTSLNDEIRKSYTSHKTSFDTLDPEERLQVSIIIYSAKRKEVWSFGDCCVKINDNLYRHKRAGDKLMSDLRAFCIETGAFQDGFSGDPDPGRTAILPFVRIFPQIANQSGEFGYDAANGGPIHTENIIVYPVESGDRIILSSDGYPALFDTWQETENHLLELLEKDPKCIKELRGTKGVKPGNQSFDDRSYISFYAD